MHSSQAGRIFLVGTQERRHELIPARRSGGRHGNADGILSEAGRCNLDIVRSDTVRIDIHVHTKERSPCGRSSDTEQVRAAIAAGLDAIVFTDHKRLAPAESLAALNEAYAPFRVFGGIEIAADGEDLLVLGLRDPLLETGTWTYPDLHAYVRQRGGFLAVAHPFRYHSELQLPLDRFPPDAIEVCSRNTPPAAFERIVALAERLGMIPLSNSDAHAAESLGRHYNVLDHATGHEGEMLEMLRSGRFSCVVPGADGNSRGSRHRAKPRAPSGNL